MPYIVFYSKIPIDSCEQYFCSLRFKFSGTSKVHICATYAKTEWELCNDIEAMVIHKLESSLMRGPKEGFFDKWQYAFINNIQRNIWS